MCKIPNAKNKIFIKMSHKGQSITVIFNTHTHTHTHDQTLTKKEARRDYL